MQVGHGSSRIAYVPALDGIRGVSVLAVLLFHAGFAWASGGFLGVSTFFTLSGFLITTLLLRERSATGRIALRAFWARRFRRLMPAAIVALAGITAYGGWLATPSQLSRLRWDVLSALAYVSNWRFMATANSYFELFSRPSPVQHFWSLSIEEQFYAAFPLLVAFVLARGRGRRMLGIVVAAVALASALGGALLWALGSTSARIYYGTDTRIFEILAGALLAIASDAGAERAAAGERTGVAVPAAPTVPWPSSRLAVAVGLAALAVVCADFVLVPEESDVLYQGGLVLHAVASTALIAAAVRPGLLATVLSLGPLVWLGSISYGVYLYHWPIYLALDAERTGLGPTALFALRAAATLAIAQLSYVLVEMPIRRGRLLAGMRTWVVAPIGAATVVVAAVSVTVSPSIPAYATRGPWAPEPMPARQSDAPEGPVRIMVVGDSVAWNLGIGLLAWAKAHPHVASVWNMSTYGCGIGRGGRRPGIPRSLGQLRDCDSWADWWEVQVEKFRPDVVVVHSAIWDVVDRVLPRWKRVRRPGDPRFDDWLLSEYEQAVDVLSSRGAHVVWVTAPCFGRLSPDDRITRAGAFSANRHRHVRDVVVPRLAASRAGRVTVYDLFAKVCPTGRYRQVLPGVGIVRQDGVHLSPRGATWVAEELGPFAIASASVATK